MQLIFKKYFLSAALTCIFLFGFTLIPFHAYGDGLTQENLPPASVGNRQASLFIKISPPILTSENIQDTFLQLRLFDANNNETIVHTSFFITVTKNDQLLMRDLFHTHSGLLILKIKPTNTPGNWVSYGDKEPFQGGWTSTNDQLRVDAPILLEGGLYHFAIEVFGIDNDRNIFKPEDAPKFDAWLSVGDIFHNTITFQQKPYDTTIISYYDKINDFKFDESKKRISYSMPFNWDLSRLATQNIFVHEEIHFPKTFKEFVDSPTFDATASGFPLVGRMLAIDPYSKPDTLILHLLINKQDIIEMGKSISPNTPTMDFTVSPGIANAHTSTEILTDFGGYRAELGWSSTDLKANTNTNLKITFFDAFAGKQVSGDVKYDLKILDKNGIPTFSKTDLDAIGATDTQSIDFPSNGVYTLEIDIKSITINGKTDSSRLGTARGYAVIPSTVVVTPKSDTIAPTLTPPPNQSVTATSSGGAVVNYPQPTATDNVVVASGPTCTPSSGSTFSIGTTTVKCTASDATGNVGSTTFTVTVTQSTPSPPKSGCLIATAAFGSEMAPQVQQLRETRDKLLLNTQSGTSFMTAFNQFYYTFSPTVADWERENPVFKQAVKITITPLISTLSILNYVDIDSEPKMLFYGISLILLNIGIYFVAPALIIIRLKTYKVHN